MFRTLFLILFLSSISLAKINPASTRTELYLPLLKDKRVALVVNQSSVVNRTHLVDLLLKKRVRVKKIFAPEHGFRGGADAGHSVKNSIDKKTSLPIISLYGKKKKPTKKDLKNIDIIVFDIQDVGVRFYTYLSTLHYILEVSAKYKIPVIVLDRPNPNAHYIDGEVLNRKYSSFIGLDPVPIVYGMTIGEYAKMLNGEGWLRKGLKANLKVIPIKNYIHNMKYKLPIKPSPNLPTQKSILLYPSLALFEGTVFSAGRGTKQPFELYGHPKYKNKSFSFIPKSRVGAKYPKFKNRRCYGVNLRDKKIKNSQIDLSFILDAYKKYPNKKSFFLKNRFIDKLSGSNRLRLQIQKGYSQAQIRASWQKGLREFKKIREKYLIYK
jgi:uncharacterized protein YbbC (DUF1343 family)